MRSPLDRLRHAISFELIALALAIPLGALIFGLPMPDMGVVGIVGATVAMLWNMAFNFGFDLALRQLTGCTKKTGWQRILHAVLFEIGLVLILIPFLAWYLQITLWQALAMNVFFALFYMLYALVFNWAYDRLFPLPEWERALSRD